MAEVKGVNRRQCEARLLETCRKLQALVSEAPVSYDRALYLSAVRQVERLAGKMERLRVE